MPIPLLITKITPPSISGRLVSRSVIQEGLAKWRDYRLVLLSAPPGFGKTTLLAEWLKNLREPSAWLTLDEGDNDPLRFIQYLVAALQITQPGIAQAVLAMVQSPPPGPLDEYIPAVMSLLINEIASRPGQLILVLDDTHTVGSPLVYQVVNFLLEHMPANLHLVMATRADPPVPLALLRSRRQLTELRAPQLRFSAQEADEFLRRVMGLDIRPEEARSLGERTEGWVAGLQLAGLALQGRGDIPGFIHDLTGSSHYVLDYLFEEVLIRQPAEIQEFLLKTSILERLTAALCDALLGQADSQNMLDTLEHANLFILPLDPGRTWFGYHRLFADLLQHQLNRLHPEQVPTLHSKAAAWLEQHALYSESVGHWIKAGELGQAARLVREQGMSLLENGQLMLVLTWMELLPEALIRADPWLCVYHAWALLLSGHASRAALRVQEAEQAMSAAPVGEGGDFQPLLGHIDALRAYLALMGSDPREMVPLAQRSLQRLPEEALSIRAILAYLLGGGYLLAGQTDQAALSFEQAYRQGKAAGNIHIALPALRAQTGLLIAKGQLHQARARCQEAIQADSSTQLQSLPVAAGIYLTLGELAYEWNDLDGAARSLESGLTLSRGWGNADTLLVSLVDMARLKAAQGNANAARGWLREAEQTAQTHRLTPGTDGLLAAAQFKFYLAGQDTRAAEALVMERKLHPDGELKVIYLREWLAYAHYLIRSEQWLAAQTVLARLAEFAGGQGRKGDLTGITVCQAVLEAQWGKQAQALQTLEGALVLAQPEGYVRTFVDEGQPVWQLLSSLSRLSSASLSSYRDQLLLACTPGQNIAHPTSELIEPLTGRELELLSLIEKGLSNEEIAKKLVISIGTVKAHTSNIYRKMDVRGRTQALSKARDLGLL